LDQRRKSRAFLKVFAGAAAGIAASLFAVVLLLDPYGVSPLRLPFAPVIMDINQRYMYPQIARAGLHDSVVIGTSTSRLLDPKALDAAFGGRFANLAMNAGTAWEQTELAKLFLKRNPTPRTFILGLDQMWCLPEKVIERTTFRGFPAWLYDDTPLNDIPELFNLKTLEVAGRVAMHHAGLMPERIRSDGYEIFTPPEATYDLARARFHIWKDRPGRRITPEAPPRTLTEKEAQALALPAVAWLDDLLARLPPGSRRLLVHMPLHIAAQPTPGSLTAAQVALCKERIDVVGAKHKASVIDFAIDSPLTREDANYWDPLHYRLPIAERIIEGMKQGSATGVSDPAGFYVVRRPAR
jgi:hypothetical protein